VENPHPEGLSTDEVSKLNLLRTTVAMQQAKNDEYKKEIDRLKALKMQPPDKKGCCTLI